jgi:aldehyde dehydrogenase (NAD+)
MYGVAVPAGFINLLRSQEEFFPTPANQGSDFARIVSSGQFKRIYGLLEKTEGTVVFGGAKQCEEATKYIAPTLVADCKETDSLMSE